MPILSRAGAAAARGFGMLGKIARAVDEYFKYVTLLLPGNGTNGAQNNTFLDSSTNNFTITRNGNTTQGTFAPYGSNWGNYFDGSGDYLALPDNAALEPGSSNLTWELWINTTNSTQYATLYSRTTASFSTGMWSLMMNFASSTAGDVALFVGDFNLSSPLLQTTGANVRDGAWHHIAVVRNGSAWTIYVDGTSRATATWAGTIADISGGPYVGRDQYYGRDYTDYISNLRIVKGTAVYTSAFTPPTSPLTAITNTSLLTCQSNRFIDNSSSNFSITVSGSPSVQRFSPFSPTAPYAAGTDGGSGYFDGTGDYLSAPSNSAFDFTGDATVECWIYPTALANNSQLFGFNDALSDLKWIGALLSTSGALSGAATAGAGGSYASASGVVKTGCWQHIAWVKNGSTVFVYVNGVQVASTASSNAYAYQASPLIVGRVDGNNTLCFNGYMTDLRVVKGTAVYTSAFTPPTAPLTAITNTQLLTNFTNAGIIDNAEMNDLETVGNAQISTAQSKFGGGSMYFDGTGDWILSPTSPNLDLSSGNWSIECWYYPTTYSAGNNVLLYIGASSSDKIVIATIGASGYLYYLLNGSVVISSTSAASLNAWSHFALVRNGSTTTLYLNGTSIGTTSSTPTSSSKSISLGADAGAAPYIGYIDDLRITKGYARYTSSFTAPTAPFPLS